MKCIHIKQHDERDCGAACLAMISQYYGKYLSVSKARELIKVDQYGANIYGIVIGAEKIGLKAKAIEGEKNDFCECIEKGDIEFPFIARVLIDCYEHFVVVYSIKNNKLKISDPAMNKMCVWDMSVFLDRWLNNLIVLQKKDSFTTERCQTIFVKYLKLFYVSPKAFLILVILSLILSAINLCGTAIFKLLLTDLHLTFMSLDKLCIALVLAFLLQFIVSIVRGNVLAKVSKKIDVDISMKYFWHLLDLPLEALESRNSGEYLSRFEDISIIREVISTVSVTIILDFLVVIISSVLLFSINSSLFFISLMIVVLEALFLIFLQPKIVDINHKAMIEQSKVLSTFNECIKGIESIKAFVFEKKSKQTFDGIYNRYAEINRQSNVKINGLNCILDFIESIGIVLIFYIGMHSIINGTLNIASLFSFYYILNYFTSPAKGIIMIQPLIKISKVAFERLDDIQDLSIEDNEGKELCEIKEGIQIDHLSFAYGYRKNILNDISIFIPKRKKVAIIGESGGGKSTLSKIMVGLYRSPKGSVKIDNVNIDEFSRSSLKKKIIYLPQQAFIKDDTVINNIIFGEDKLSYEIVKKKIELNGFDKILKRASLSYDQLLTENGKNISGGQKQIIAIIRAVVRNPEIIIMDESTNSLDKKTEDIVFDILNKMERLTLINITHNEARLSGFDMIYQINDGKLVSNNSSGNRIKH